MTGWESPHPGGFSYTARQVIMISMDTVCVCEHVYRLVYLYMIIYICCVYNISSARSPSA